ncbi:hypothetical protein [Paenibacillus silvae]|uniref:Uncharacterized protein n=1 Tax=Paenibacillus silvae TaxID=1325358 RepID=A0A2W6NDJ7_9BACL|nr:hypothetical protein [Paenibacillus silvae]PZT54002.1 hypothetical protein DN757_19205 [Paenibacillus silvae]
MSRVNNSGFYKIKFWITPEELGEVFELFKDQEASFVSTNYAQTANDKHQVLQAYQRFYDYYAAAEKAADYFPHFVYSIVLTLDQDIAGIFVRNEGIGFPYHKQWAVDELPCIMISLPQYIRIQTEDAEGADYTYEDIREHRPQAYQLYEELSNEIKTRTKLLRFSVTESGTLYLQKPSVRISREAAEHIRNGWIFDKYKLVMETK